MRKLILILSFLSLFSGCAFLESQKESFDACLNDPVCYSMAKEWQETGKLAGSIGGSLVPGVAPVSSIVGGYIALGLALIILGKGVLKKKNES